MDASVDELPDIRVIAAGSFDGSSRFKPTMDLYTSSAQAWVPMDPALEKYETEPSR